jgi:hypothetical protein
MNFTVGQTMLHVTIPQNQGTDYKFHEVKITKVGRSWLTLDNGQRAEIETLIVDGGHYFSSQKLYLDREQFDAEMALDQAWRELRRAVDRHIRTPTTNIEAIREAAALLNLKIGDAEPI